MKCRFIDHNSCVFAAEFVKQFSVDCLHVERCRHNNFVLVSGLVTQNPLVDSGLLAASLLAELLLCLNTPEDTRLLPSVVKCCIL